VHLLPFFCRIRAFFCHHIRYNAQSVTNYIYTELSRLITFIFLVLLITGPGFEAEAVAQAQTADDTFRIARLQYRGGGDWYNDPSALTNLLRYARETLPIAVSERYDDVAPGSNDLHNYPFVFMTGHGNIDMNPSEAENLRRYLDNGGFLYIDDDYGFDPYVRTMLESVFPNDELIEIPLSHPVYTIVHNFPQGLPKIHEHDGKAPQGFGLFRNGRMVIFYTYESNPSDGWAYDVHNPPADIRRAALEMGVNILVYALMAER
jgi:hypothetical protein